MEEIGLPLPNALIINEDNLKAYFSNDVKITVLDQLAGQEQKIKFESNENTYELTYSEVRDLIGKVTTIDHILGNLALDKKKHSEIKKSIFNPDIGENDKQIVAINSFIDQCLNPNITKSDIERLKKFQNDLSPEYTDIANNILREAEKSLENNTQNKIKEYLGKAIDTVYKDTNSSSREQLLACKTNKDLANFFDKKQTQDRNYLIAKYLSLGGEENNIIEEDANGIKGLVDLLVNEDSKSDDFKKNIADILIAKEQKYLYDHYIGITDGLDKKLPSLLFSEDLTVTDLAELEGKVEKELENQKSIIKNNTSLQQLPTTQDKTPTNNQVKPDAKQTIQTNNTPTTTQPNNKSDNTKHGQSTINLGNTKSATRTTNQDKQNTKQIDQVNTNFTVKIDVPPVTTTQVKSDAKQTIQTNNTPTTTQPNNKSDNTKHGQSTANLGNAKSATRTTNQDKQNTKQIDQVNTKSQPFKPIKKSSPSKNQAITQTLNTNTGTDTTVTNNQAKPNEKKISTSTNQEKLTDNQAAQTKKTKSSPLTNQAAAPESSASSNQTTDDKKWGFAAIALLCFVGAIVSFAALSGAISIALGVAGIVGSLTFSATAIGVGMEEQQVKEENKVQEKANDLENTIHRDTIHRDRENSKNTEITVRK